MTKRKTLQLREASESESAAPAIKKKGRGWEVSEKRRDVLHDRARAMRREPSEAHKALAERFSAADFGRYSFTRFAVVGSAIVDFNSHNLGLAIMIDEVGQDETLARRRDKSLEAVGIRVMRISASDILDNMDDVLVQLTIAMRARIAEKAAARKAHYAASKPAHGTRRGGQSGHRGSPRDGPRNEDRGDRGEARERRADSRDERPHRPQRPGRS